MKQLYIILLSVVSCCVLAAVCYGVVPSSRPGMGAVPYGSGTMFRVWAPNATTVNVAGSFNGWNGSNKPLASEGNGYWSVDVEGAGAFQGYRYVINGSIWKTDPRAEDVSSSIGEGIIVDSSYYNWAPFQTPAWNDLIIYEMHIGTFNDTPGGGPGTWASAMAKLDHIQDLGVNAVEVMPIYEFPGDFSMGYNPVNLFAPESAYGTCHDMRNFINACHQRGIAVLIDVVYNHLGPSDLRESIWQFDGYSAYPDTGGIYFFEDERRYTPWGDRPNYTMGEVRQFIRDNALYWLDEYHADGLRVDGTAYIRWNNHMDKVDIPGGWSLMQWINDEIDAVSPGKISIAEDMQNDEWLTKTTGEGGAGFDSQWDADYHHKLVYALTRPDDFNRNMWDVSYVISHLYNGWDTQRVIYTESHDEVGKSSDNLRLPEAIWEGNASSWYSKKRSTLGAGIVLTSPGIPMIFMGQEFLEEGAWHDDVPLDWNKDITYAGIKALYRDLIALRRNMQGNTKGLMGKNVNVFHVNDTDKVIAYHRWYHGGVGDDVVVVANFADRGYTDYNIGMPRGGLWRVRFNSDWIGYDATYENWNSYDTYAGVGAKHGLAYNANVRIGKYSMIILSQGTGPDIDGIDGVDLKDFAILAAQWQNGCNDNDSCQGADFDMSGSVDMTDLYRFVSSWLEGKL